MTSRAVDDCRKKSLHSYLLVFSGWNYDHPTYRYAVQLLNIQDSRPCVNGGRTINREKMTDYHDVVFCHRLRHLLRVSKSHNA